MASPILFGKKGKRVHAMKDNANGHKMSQNVSELLTLRYDKYGCAILITSTPYRHKLGNRCRSLQEC